MKLKTILVTILACLAAVQVQAVTKVKGYTIKDGLSDSSPRCMIQDKDGLLWIGTWNGVNRFDGGTFESMDAILDSFFGSTNQIEEGGDGIFWVCNHNGINRIDTRTGECEALKIGRGRTPQLIDAFRMAVSGDGEVFCSYINWGIYHYNTEAGEMQPLNIPDVNNGKITELFCIGNDKLAVHEYSGAVFLVSYISTNGRIEIKGSEDLMEGRPVSGIFQTAKGLCLATPDNKLHILDNESGTVTKSFDIPQGLFSAGAGNAEGTKATISFRYSSSYEINLIDGSFSEIDALKGGNVACLLYGSEGILWAGLNGGGLMAVWEDTSGMNRILNKDICGERVANVSSFMEMAGGDMLVATEGDGMYILHPDRSFKTIDKTDGLYNDKVYVLEKGLGDDIFIGHEGKGINILSGGKISGILADEGNIVNVYAIRRDDRLDCWYLGVYGQGIARIRVKKNSGGQYSVTELKEWFLDDPNSFAGKHASCLLPLSDGRLIVGTLSEGCLVFDPETGSFLKSRLCSESVLSLYMDPDSSLWIGTGGYGLKHIIKKAPGDYITEVYDKECGMKDSSIHGILQDNKGRIWVSTNVGISCLDPTNGTVVNYYDDDCLQSNEFSNSACLNASDGSFLFGGVEGFNRFDPLTVTKREYEPNLRIKRFSLLKEPGRVVPTNETIVLKHNENYFSIDFSAIEFIENGNCEYSYRLKGFDDQWIGQTAASPVTYINIPHGKYSFEVRTTNGDKMWSSRTASLDIRIRRPWWNTYPAYLLYAIAAFGAACIINTVAQRRLKRKREMELEIIQKRHENETYEAKLRFFTNIAHEFGTPLTLITGAGEQLSSSYGHESKPARYVNVIKDNAERMQRLIKELMDFRKVDTGNYQLTFSKFDIAGMTRHIVDGYSDTGERDGIAMTLDVPEGPMWFISDYNAVEKILHNLVSNAYKYTPEQGSIEVSLAPEGDSSLRLSVTNSGKGIKPEDLPKVFDRFTILDNLESEAKEGKVIRNGIGLALVNSLVGELGGEISVASKRGKSTVFTVVLPSAKEEQINGQAPLSSSELYITPEPKEYSNSVPSKTGETIIIVDDEKEIRDMVRDILCSRYTILQAGNGKEAVELISHGLPDLIITDISMPEMDGIELCRYLKENEITRNIPIVFLSFLSDIQNEISSFETGGEAFIPKPFHPRHLVAVVNKILSGRNSLKAYYGSVISNSDMLNEKVVMKGDRDFIMKATSLVESDLSNENLTPAYLCEEMNISKAQLYRKLKELVGMSPVEFIRSIKLEHAAHKLKTTDLTVQEIMYSVGFNNKSYFYREFGKKYGVSPKEYRMSE